MLSWFVPMLVFLGALFVETAGLFGVTASYVRWMDELNKVSLHQGPQRGLAQAFTTLVDPASRCLQRLTETLGVLWLSDIWMDILPGLLLVLWLVRMAHAQDLRLWTHVLLTGATLALLKGILAWATVLPDPAGWQGCQHRLGKEGLAYFRQAAGNGGMGPLQSMLDMLLLELRSLLVVNLRGRQCFCADTVFSGHTSFCMLICLSLYDAARSWTEDHEATRQTSLRGIAGLLLGLALLGGLLLELASLRHYTLDMVLAVPLVLLVYGSPAVALATERWVNAWSVVPSFAEEAEQPQCLESRMPPRLEDLGFTSVPQASMEREPADVPLTDDLGRAAVPPCCLPFCYLSGTYYFRGDSGIAGLLPWTEASEQSHQEQLADFKEIRMREAQRCCKLDSEITREYECTREHREEANAKAQEWLEMELQRLSAVGEEALEKVRQQREEAQAVVARLRDQAAAEARRCSALEEEFEPLRCRLSGSVQECEARAAAARSACREYQQRMRESEREREALRRVLAECPEPPAAWEAPGPQEAGAEPEEC